MAKFKITQKTTVAELKEQFRNEVGGVLRIYDGRSEAAETATLVSIGAKVGELECRTSRTVGKFEEAFQEDLNLKVKVYTKDNWVKVLDGITLEAASQLPNGMTKEKMEAFLGYEKNETSEKIEVSDEKSEEEKDEKVCDTKDISPFVKHFSEFAEEYGSLDGEIFLKLRNFPKPVTSAEELKAGFEALAESLGSEYSDDAIVPFVKYIDKTGSTCLSFIKNEDEELEFYYNYTELDNWINPGKDEYPAFEFLMNGINRISKSGEIKKIYYAMIPDYPPLNPWPEQINLITLPEEEKIKVAQDSDILLPATVYFKNETNEQGFYRRGDFMNLLINRSIAVTEDGDEFWRIES